MSSLLQDSLAQIRGTRKGEETCVKCKESLATIDIRFAVYCSSCFQEATHHKYRTLLARCRSHTTTATTHVLLLLTRDYMHSLADRMLLHFSQLSAIEDPARKGLAVCSVALPVVAIEDIDRAVAFAIQIKTVYPRIHAVHLLPLPMALTRESCMSPSSPISQLDWSQHTTNMHKLTPTVRQDLEGLLLLRLQLRLMQELRIERGLVSDTSTDTASCIISATCKGRGRLLPWDSALLRQFPDSRGIARPLRDISDRETQIYAAELRGQFLFDDDALMRSLARPVATEPGAISIDDLTTRFLSGLETDYPGTANVVIRTSAKVTTGMNEEDDTRCVLCFAPGERTCVSCQLLMSQSGLVLE